MTAGIRIATEADVEAIARVRVHTWQATYGELLPADFLHSMADSDHLRDWTERLGRGWRGQLLVATENDAVVGFIHGGEERSGDVGHSHEIYALYILPECQREGRGRALITELLRRLGEDGALLSLLVWVLSGNPNRDFYSRLGATTVRSQPIDIGGTPLEETAYGWADARPLINNRPSM